MAILLQRSAVTALVRTGCSLLNHCSKTQRLFMTTTNTNRSTQESPQSKPAATPRVSKQWSPIYRLTLVHWAAAFNRLKIYQTLVTVIGTPTIFALEQSGQLSSGIGTTFGLIGLSGVIALGICSFGAKNLIGIIYTNETEDKVKLAYVDYWGRRKETEIDVNDILIDTDMPSSLSLDWIQAIRLESDSKLKFKLLKRFGNILEPITFTSIFGE